MSSAPDALPLDEQPLGGSPPIAAPSRSLRSRLFMLAASGLVPLALGLVMAAAYLADVRRSDAERSAVELSRALASGIDAELRSTISLLQALASVSELQDIRPDDLAGSEFAAQASRVVATQGWQLVTVADASGRLLMRTSGSPSMLGGAGKRSRVVEEGSMAQAIETRAPVVGTVARGPLGYEAFPVRVPVMKDGRLVYVLTAVVGAQRVLDLIVRQKVASNWVVGVFDDTGLRIARSPPTESRRYADSLGELVKRRGNEGSGRTTSLEGIESHTGFSRVATSQWIVAIGIPTVEVNLDSYRLLAALGAGMAASLGLLAWLAWRAALAISGPIDTLKNAAAGIGAGRELRLPPLGVTELDEVAAALQRSARELAESNQRRSKVEVEREQLLERVGEALTEAELANRNKDEFLALLGHELRNPLAPIKNALHLMEIKADPATTQERAVIHRQLSYVSRLVDDLLDAARINSGRLVLSLQPLRPVRVLEQTVDAVRPSLGARMLRVDIEAQAREAWVNADEARLVQVFNNLIGNAIKFTAPDGRVSVSATLHEQQVEISIADNGVGMAPAELARAFEIFYQAPGSPRGVKGGLGLGLAIVRSLVEMHGGSVRAYSDGPGLGVTVTLRLPLTASPAEEARATPVRAAVAGVRVLVCDDNEDAATTLEMVLAVSGYDARAVYTPEAAIEAFAREAPQVAILDIGLPRIDGYELARRLRALPGGDRCRMVALTGYGQRRDIEKAMAAGFDDHLTKPADPEQLLRLLAGFVAPAG